MITCPHCNGDRRVFAFWDGHHEDGTPFGGSGYVSCRTCNGSGEITDGHMARILAGKKRRDDRVARGVSLKEEAESLGMTPVELSAIERGK